ncbi:putative ribosome quality control (RQC) complex component, YloA/Tae2 family [Arcobacter acticola]|uniref:Putative ribosome quality control (RQC) complex component, YloA/Tae2 family n=1 Tax=Arcobacter acticola TaxID=1849015 RepID=A0A6M8EDY6_9BACT|nr:NFACT RNA binding domain-containing protein [Arcobacter acticola]QKE27496.1 putative ribosome quality control (RQC) complex component, YloA/Tae2 family [Arcobacter acticola]
MKYFLLKEIVAYLSTNVQNIKIIKRIDNNIIIIEFNNKNTLYFDMSKGNSTIFKCEKSISSKKDFNAPFDIALQKRFINSKIENIELYNDDKIINIRVNSFSSYKKLTTILQLEFTGKHTNIIILDENRVILEALRHIDEFSSSRVVKVGIKLEEIPKQSFIPKIEEVVDIEKYLYEIYEEKQKQSLENVKKQKISQIDKKAKKLKKTIDSLPKKEELELESNEFYEKANLILSNLHNLKPYQKSLKVYNYQGIEVEIDLEEKPSASKYSNELFKKAKRAKQKALNISLEKDNLDEKLEFLLRLMCNIKNANSIEECDFLSPKKEKNQIKTKKAQAYESFYFEGFKIMLGTSERENIYLLQNSKASDFWFHLKDRPSCHVIVQNTKKTIPDSVIEQAAILCAKFSVDFTGNIDVDFTQRRNVKIQSGANVLYNPYSTIGVKI